MTLYTKCNKVGKSNKELSFVILLSLHLMKNEKEKNCNFPLSKSQVGDLVALWSINCAFGSFLPSLKHELSQALNLWN